MSEPPPAIRRRAAAGTPPAAARTEMAVSRLAPAWRRLLPGAGHLARRAARAALAGAAARDGRGPRRAAELSLVLADDRLVHHLNHQYRHIDKPTNVLSFPGGVADADADEAGSAPPGATGRGPARAEPGTLAPEMGGPEMLGPQMLGDVVLAAETVAAEASAQGKAMADHFTHLVVHGVLHLLGYDHMTPADARAMESLEVEVLAGLGIADPYRAAARRPGRRSGRGAARG